MRAIAPSTCLYLHSPTHLAPIAPFTVRIRSRGSIASNLSLAVYLMHIPVMDLSFIVWTKSCKEIRLVRFAFVAVGSHIFGGAAFYGLQRPIATRLLRCLQGAHSQEQQKPKGADVPVGQTSARAVYGTNASQGAMGAAHTGAGVV